jgi:hypothetical protein
MRWNIGVLVFMCATTSWSGTDSVEAAQEDLAGRLQISVEQITVVSQTEKSWPDKSLGCPRKGMSYAQVLSNGSELILEAAGRKYAYHSGPRRPYFYCANPDRVGGRVTPAVLPHHRTYGSVYGGSR